MPSRMAACLGAHGCRMPRFFPFAKSPLGKVWGLGEGKPGPQPGGQGSPSLQMPMLRVSSLTDYRS